ncbi:hypothetical protein M3C36_13850 [Dietzia cinnamea]|uniref:hypothetical protein n=1 Tax=Dietzia TaxID=37914 RepID=UPI000D08E4ED|nr:MULTISPECIES: hypothetical protein [Dietzia]AVM66195.1 hypothetical protein C3V38_16715 [Dietzia sp. oral taxon 368]MCT1886248.1 hypothetical protein [Dietzia cinnamea]MCT2302341.1 hypothetical protein [Dietzia cinnamea]
MSAKKKVFAVGALTLGGIAGATGTAYAAQGGVATEAPSGTTTIATQSPSAKSDTAKPTSTKKQSSSPKQTSAPAPTIKQAEKSQSRASSGGQGGVTTELPAERKAEAKTDAKPAATTAPTQQASAPARAQADTSARAATTATPAAVTQSAPTATVQPASRVTPAQAASPQATSPQAVAPQAVAPQTAQQETAPYADVSAVSGADTAGESRGQGGVATELPAPDPAPAADATVEAAGTEAGSDYSERVQAASQTPTSGTFTPAAPAEPVGQVSAYSAPRDNGAEVGIAAGGVATGTAVEVSDTTSYVSNTTTGGGEQATAAQTWDASNGNYNATWATTGGVSGTGGFSATNEQTAPNVGTAGVDGQWSSPDGASTVSVTGGATLANYGIHDASGSIEISTPIGDMAFTF